ARQSKPIYKEIKVKNIIENVLYNIQHKAREHKIEINIHQNLPPVWADSDKLEQVLMNLVDNAVKYSNPGTIVNIDAGFVQNRNDMVEIKVTDHGFGIPEKFLSKVFTKFSRIDSPLTRQVQGTGLGLYITKSLVNSMKGDITIESSDKGSIFTVTLPAAFPETHTKQRFQENN
ncbi:MAG: HAMP domain-containing histidine kinase, partial [Candidatus Aenigmarchaeota archaeon]|nr:HAMP domain-containing histidine kinase [Candidatus Aenigmarchaeota archaeon]